MLYEIQETAVYSISAPNMDAAKAAFLDSENADEFFTSVIERTITPISDQGLVMHDERDEF